MRRVPFQSHIIDSIVYYSFNAESLLITGLNILPAKFVTVTAYTDIFKSQWIGYTTAAPLAGYDFQIEANCHISKKADLLLRYKNKKKDKKLNDGMLNINSAEEYKKTRLHFQFNPSKTITLKTRLEHVIYKMNNKERGLMAFQDIQFSPKKTPLNISARVAWFNTESYNSRIYAYENDLLYTFSMPAYYDNGFRTYLNVKYKLIKNIEIWFKIANTTLNDTESTGSGYNKIMGNKKSEVKFQLRLKI